MKLLWKVLRENISIAQLSGFMVANILGLAIVAVSMQMYLDVQPLFSEKSGVISPDFLVVSKPVTALGTITGASPSFSAEEIEELRGQSFVRQLGEFTAAQYAVVGQLVAPQYDVNISTDMFFESVPELFVDVRSDDWSFNPGDAVVPIIIPRDYLNLYNFGFAQSSHLPTISEGLVSKVYFNLRLYGNGRRETLKGRIVGFSSRLNTILVPETFMRWSNGLLASPNDMPEPSRLIVQVDNPASPDITTYFDSKNYRIDGDKLQSSKLRWLMRIITAVVITVGIVICALAFYVLMLSIFLLVQRNRQSINNLLAVGYAPRTVAAPYQCMVVVATAASAVLAAIIFAAVRTAYLKYLFMVMPDYAPCTIGITLVALFSLALILALLNALLVRKRIS